MGIVHIAELINSISKKSEKLKDNVSWIYLSNCFNLMGYPVPNIKKL